MNADSSILHAYAHPKRAPAPFFSCHPPSPSLIVHHTSFSLIESINFRCGAKEREAIFAGVASTSNLTIEFCIVPIDKINFDKTVMKMQQQFSQFPILMS